MTVVHMETWKQFRVAAELESRYALTGLGIVANLGFDPNGGPTSYPGTNTARTPPGVLKFLGLSVGTGFDTEVKLAVTDQAEYIVAFYFRADEDVGGLRDNDTPLKFMNGAIHLVTLEVEKTPNNADDLYPEGVDEFGAGHDNDGNKLFNFQIDLSTGSGSLYDGDATGINDYFLYGVWYYVEIRVLIGNGDGEVDFSVDGTSLYSRVGLDTQPGGETTIDNIKLNSGDPGASSTVGDGLAFSIADFIVIDPTTSPNTQFPYPAVIDTLRPTAETAQIDFTPESGVDNSAMVDDPAQHDYDSTNNESDTAAHEDRFTTADVVPDNAFGDALAVDVVSMVKDGADLGTRTMRSRIFEGATVGNGATLTLTESDWQQITGLFNLNPDTGLVWTYAEIEAAEFGYEIIT
jgi:hypothetical protein